MTIFFTRVEWLQWNALYGAPVKRVQTVICASLVYPRKGWFFSF